MVYDPNNPNPQLPGGMAAITSVPGGAGMPQRTNPGGRVAPVPGGAPASPGFSMPNLPNVPGMPTLPGFSNPGAGPVSPGGMPPVPGGGMAPPARPGGIPPVGGGFANGGQFNIDGLKAFIDNYKNTLFQWLSTRPQDPAAMGDWRTTRPQFDPQGLMAAMFAPPPAPAPAPAATPSPAAPTIF